MAIGDPELRFAFDAGMAALADDLGIEVDADFRQTCFTNWKQGFDQLQAIVGSPPVVKDNTIEYLQFMVDKMYSCLGPADDDIVQSIKEQWVAQGNKLPKGHGDD